MILRSAIPKIVPIDAFPGSCLLLCFLIFWIPPHSIHIPFQVFLHCTHIPFLFHPLQSFTLFPFPFSVPFPFSCLFILNFYPYCYFCWYQSAIKAMGRWRVCYGGNRLTQWVEKPNFSNHSLKKNAHLHLKSGSYIFLNGPYICWRLWLFLHTPLPPPQPWAYL